MPVVKTYWGDPIHLESTQKLSKPWWAPGPKLWLGEPEKGGHTRDDSGIRNLFRNVPLGPIGLVEDAIIESQMGHNSGQVTWDDHTDVL